jgi:hypothetical protein
MPFKVKALYDYVSGHEDDLGFTAGQIITVTEEEDDDWYSGEYVDDSGAKQEGIFPRNFVEKVEPTAPPRPTRARPKKEPEPAPAPAPEAATPPPQSPKQAAPEPEETPEPEPAAVVSPPAAFSAPPPAPAPVAEPRAPKPVQPVQAAAAAPAPAPPAPQPTEARSAISPPAPKPAPSLSKPSGPPPVSEKPTSNSFKDRIAAFNRAAAPPIAPFKPSGLSSGGGGGGGFIKKPFVAAPPSRHAYIPPSSQAPIAKVYRRDEDPEVKEQEAEVLENAGRAGLVPMATANEGEAAEDEPKPMSLRERLALLQKQQMETAARHAEAATKKEKPKRPAKKRLDSQDTIEGEAAERTEETSRMSTEEAHPPRVAHPPRRRSSKGAEPRDGNEADMSGAGETTEGQEDITEKDDSDGRTKHVATVSKKEDSDQGEEEDEDEEEEDDVDPELRRREELRARMAKMSGGMGMPGMAMPLFGAPAPMLPKKKKTPVAEKSVEEVDEPVSPTTRAAPVPLPGLMRPPPPPEPKQQESEEEDEEEEESRLKTPHQEPAPSG